MAKPYNEKSALDIKDSVPVWPPFLSLRALEEGSPNVLVMAWDVGFVAMDVFGGLAETPTIRRIANQCVRFWNFHATALCSPTRSSLLARHTATPNGTASVAKFAYQGSSHVFDRAMVYFASAYADQKQRDYEVLTSAIKVGTLSEPGVWSRTSGSASGVGVHGIEQGTTLHGP